MPALLARKPPLVASVETALSLRSTEAFNLVGRIRAGKPKRGLLIIGAHYDHLGFGGRASLAPDRHEPHPGADDNASGTATVLELARMLAARRSELSRDVLIMLFSGEESGLLGSAQYARTHPEVLRDSVAMINLDMVGRLRGNRLDVLGTETAPEWSDMVKTACDAEGITCAGSSDGFGSSDQASFYAAGLPVLHFFTGTHSDYHKPSDTADRLNAAGAAAVARVVERVVFALEPQEKLTYKTGIVAPARGDSRSFNASLGTIPDYAGPPNGAPGVLLSGVRPGGAAEQAGMKAGDILIRLGPHDIRSVQDLGFALNNSKPGETVTATVLRDGKEVKLETTFQESRAPR
jgi:Zn-dependent M28 family amino/carboxypeptidase